MDEESINSRRPIESRDYLFEWMEDMNPEFSISELLLFCGVSFFGFSAIAYGIYRIIKETKDINQMIEESHKKTKK